ncbi:8550_t:CDS:2, partial [Ambispora leptoticha]
TWPIKKETCEDRMRRLKLRACISEIDKEHQILKLEAPKHHSSNYGREVIRNPQSGSYKLLRLQDYILEETIKFGSLGISGMRDAGNDVIRKYTKIGLVKDEKILDEYYP